MKRRVLALLLVSAMAFSLFGCSNGGGTTSSASKTAESVASNSTSSQVQASSDTSADQNDATSFKSKKPKSQWTIAVVTKDNTAAWFIRMAAGVNKYSGETGIKVIQKGPANADAASQVQVVQDLISQGVDALCVVPIDPAALEPTLKTAMKKGIVVVTHEASNQKNTLYDIEAFTPERFGSVIMDNLATAMGQKGKYAEMVGYTTSTTHMEYAKAQLARQKAAYPNMQLINNGTIPSAQSEESQDKAYERAKEILKANPDLAGFTGVASTDCPGIAKAVNEMGLTGKVKIVGVGTPNEFKPFIKSNTISTLLLWDPAAAGYAMCNIATKILNGEKISDGVNLGATGWENMKFVSGSNKDLTGSGELVITSKNIDQYNF